MQEPSGSSGVSLRTLRAAARLLLCLALVLLPVAGVSAAHFESAAAAAHGDGHGSDPSSPEAAAPFCHQAGACYACLTPAAPPLAHAITAAVPPVPAARVPVSADMHRLFRPPIARA
jgi:hypothetical protein